MYLWTRCHRSEGGLARERHRPPTTRANRITKAGVALCQGMGESCRQSVPFTLTQIKSSALSFDRGHHVAAPKKTGPCKGAGACICVFPRWVTDRHPTGGHRPRQRGFRLHASAYQSPASRQNANNRSSGEWLRAIHHRARSDCSAQVPR